MILIILIGVVAGIALGALGSAWGAITVPLLLLSGINPMVTKGVVLSSEVVVSGIGVASHAQLRNIKKELSMALAFGIVGAVIGSYLSKCLPTTNFKVIVGVYEILAGGILLTTRPWNVIDIETNAGLKWAILIGLIAGFVKGFLGTGWGPVGITLLVILGALPKSVVGSSLVARMLVSGSAAAYYITSGYFSATTATLLIAGGLIGVLLGSNSTRFMGEKDMRIIMGILILLLGIILILRRIGG